MATNVILPALGMSQDTGKIVHWLKAEGEQVVKGEPLVEIETDKATVEIEAPADGVLARISAAAGDDVPVGQVIAIIADAINRVPTEEVSQSGGAYGRVGTSPAPTAASPLASRIAAEYNVDLSQVKSAGRRIQKADVLTYLQATQGDGNQEKADAINRVHTARLTMALPKARRFANEQGIELAAIKGSGPEGAVLGADVLAVGTRAGAQTKGGASPAPTEVAEPTMMVNGANELALSNVWRIMAERTTQSWQTGVPHFYLVREVNTSRLMAWRASMLKRVAEHDADATTGAQKVDAINRVDTKVTYTDLLVKIVAEALRMHPRLNVSWSEGKISMKQEVHVGLAVAIEEGLVVPVIHQADTLGLGEIAQRRAELVAKAQAGKLRPQDISGGTFTISNLGMYGVDAFSAIINQPQAAILAVGRIAERVVPVNGQPSVQPMMVLTLSCDHRAVDGARGAQFLETVATLVEEPLGLLG